MSQKSTVKTSTSCVNKLFRSYGSNTVSDPDKKSTDEVLQAAIGDFGPWQCQISLFMSLLKFPIAWFQLGIVFLAPPTEFWCKPPGKYAGLSVDDWRTLIYGQDAHTEPLTHSRWCMMKNIENIGTDEEVLCPWGFDYNTTEIYSSIVTEWDLVCGRERLVDLAQIILMFGVLVGSIVFGAAADKLGRRKVLIIAIFMQSACGILSAFVPYYWMFLVLRFFLAVANGGTMTTSFVMCMEIVGGVWRTIVPILYQIPFGIGNTIMAGIAYFLRDWRQLQFVLSAMSAIYVFYFWLIPESPRWLLVVGRKEEAIGVLQKAAQRNHMDKITVSRSDLSISLRDINDTSTPASLVKTPRLRMRTILLCLNWFLCGVGFFGFSQYLGQISRNLYFAVAIGGIIAVPGTLLCVFVVKRCGRRITIAVACIFTCVCFLSILLVPKGKFSQDWPRIILAGFGVVGMSISLPALYLFTGELFPTVLRNVGLGLSVMCSKLGSMVAPLVISLGEVGWFIPLLVMGILSAIEGILVLPLPETVNTVLPETIDDIECGCGGTKNQAGYCLVDAHSSRKK